MLIKGGSDWTDAGADMVDVPDDLSMDAAYLDYGLWYRQLDRDKEDYLTFIEWLKVHRGATESKVESFWEE